MVPRNRIVSSIILSIASHLELALSYASAKRRPPGKPYSMRILEEVGAVS